MAFEDEDIRAHHREVTQADDPNALEDTLRRMGMKWNDDDFSMPVGFKVAPAENPRANWHCRYPECDQLLRRNPEETGLVKNYCSVGCTKKARALYLRLNQRKRRRRKAYRNGIERRMKRLYDDD